MVAVCMVFACMPGLAFADSFITAIYANVESSVSGNPIEIFSNSNPVVLTVKADAGEAAIEKTVWEVTTSAPDFSKYKNLTSGEIQRNIGSYLLGEKDQLKISYDKSITKTQTNYYTLLAFQTKSGSIITNDNYQKSTIAVKQVYSPYNLKAQTTVASSGGYKGVAFGNETVKISAAVTNYTDSALTTKDSSFNASVITKYTWELKSSGKTVGSKSTTTPTVEIGKKDLTDSKVTSSEIYLSGVEIKSTKYAVTAATGKIAAIEFKQEKEKSAAKFKITFDSDGGSSVSSQTVALDAVIVEPIVPKKTGYVFGGWYKQDGTKWNFDTDKVKGEMTLKAKWVTESKTETKSSVTLSAAQVDLNKSVTFTGKVEGVTGTISSYIFTVTDPSSRVTKIEKKTTPSGDFTFTDKAGQYTIALTSIVVNNKETAITKATSATFKVVDNAGDKAGDKAIDNAKSTVVLQKDSYNTNEQVSLSAKIEGLDTLKLYSYTFSVTYPDKSVSTLSSSNGTTLFTPTKAGTYTAAVTSVGYNGKVCTIKNAATVEIKVVDPTKEDTAKDDQEKTTTTVKKPSQPKNLALTTKSKTITAKWKALNVCNGYKIRISTTSSFKSGTYTSYKIKDKTTPTKKFTKCDGKKLVKGKTYYVKVQAYKYVDGKYIYGKWSTVKKIKVK